MICPKCKAEYRDGFGICADCSVPLVHGEPPGADTLAPPLPEVTPGDPEKDPFCSFWRGEDPRLHLELCDVLDQAGIPHKTVQRRDHLFHLRNFPAFEVGVPFSLFERAEIAVKEAFDLEAEPDAVESLAAPKLLPDSPSAIRLLPPMLSPPQGEAVPGPPGAGGLAEPFPEDATAEVWSGDESFVRDNLIAALHERKILCRAANNGGYQVYVLANDEPQARQIVRQILKATPRE